ncbi:translation initiation factor IF-2 [candidate division GN15 bacterium]|uniref:Translation initiation factor IF-2 n=1 Tax=candidate division GN15 bacterium TaxID=2072418 RepID=A0A855X7B2_9BACT|nr:MAG: translation initiation factor IF-2 [candidate division GN15 bacterium]
MTDLTDQKRIYELAKDYRISSPAMMKILAEMGFSPKSHMSVATDDMIVAVEKRFNQEKQVAKKEMEAKSHAKEVRERAAVAPPQAPAAVATPVAVPVGMPTPTPVPTVADMLRKAEKKKKKKERRKKRDRQDIDQLAVQKSFKTTMANLSGTAKPKRRTRRADGGDVGEVDESAPVIEVNEYITVAELAKLMDQKSAEVVAKLFELGMMATINQRLDMDTIEMVAGEFGYDVRQIAEVGEAAREEEKEEALTHRAPVVTVMGHVDHGKTSLLDYIRKTNVVAGEAGAITQHIGAYEVHRDRDRIVFLDTPGHEAFTAMRARGAHLTDIVVLVVAADESVMPQTIEAIDHARAAGVPIIVAITKIDKPAANVEQVRTQLANLNLLAEDWGGKTIMVEVSSKSGVGIDRLLDMILLQAEMMDLKADASIRAQGVVVDAHLEKGHGPTATVLVQRGTCRVGDPIVAGVYSGRIRTITNDREEKLEVIGPSTPAKITGLSGVPQAGDSFLAVKDDQEAKEISVRRSQLKREYDFRRPHGAVTLEKVFDQIKEGQIKEVRLIIKADVDGSVGVLSDTLSKISTSEVKTNIIRQGVGAITESDVLLAAASDAIIIGFQVTPDSRARDLARKEKVDIRSYNIIYEAENDVRKALEGLLAPTISEAFVGAAEVRNVFKVPKVGQVAGCYVKEGRLNRKDKVKLVRDGKTIYTGLIASLKRFKDDAREVKEGFECGVGIENFNDIKVGDVIETYETVETARTLS